MSALKGIHHCHLTFVPSDPSAQLLKPHMRRCHRGPRVDSPSSFFLLNSTCVTCDACWAELSSMRVKILILSAPRAAMLDPRQPHLLGSPSSIK